MAADLNLTCVPKWALASIANSTFGSSIRSCLNLSLEKKHQHCQWPNRLAPAFSSGFFNRVLRPHFRWPHLGQATHVFIQDILIIQALRRRLWQFEEDESLMEMSFTKLGGQGPVVRLFEWGIQSNHTSTSGHDHGFCPPNIKGVFPWFPAGYIKVPCTARMGGLSITRSTIVLFWHFAYIML